MKCYCIAFILLVSCSTNNSYPVFAPGSCITNVETTVEVISSNSQKYIIRHKHGPHHTIGEIYEGSVQTIEATFKTTSCEDSK